MPATSNQTSTEPETTETGGSGDPGGDEAAASAHDVILFDPEFVSFVYGPGDNNPTEAICFGPRGGFEPGIWIGRSDHPLLEAMLEQRPELVDVTSGPAAQQKVYVCPECLGEFGTPIAFRGHFNAKHRRKA